MNDKFDLPDGWAMPDDLSKKISEVLNNKPITPEDGLADALKDIALDIALRLPSLNNWGWESSLFGKIEVEV